MHVRNSLFFKVFSAKFFPNGNILEASEKTSGSFAWRSILKAKELILLGSSWRVGDGANISIKGTNWLLDEGHKRIISPLPNLPTDAKGRDLIHGNPPTWNLDMIRTILLPYDADAIAKIPLSDRAPPDRLIWHATRDGNYTVRSGYHMLLQNSKNSNPECSHQGEPDPLWKTIWASRVPAKVKTFLWKACHESLPTKAGLFRRRVIPHPYCDHYHGAIEDTFHALWSCPVLAQVWQSSNEFAALQKNSHHSFNSLVRHVMSLTSHLPLETLQWHAGFCGTKEISHGSSFQVKSIETYGPVPRPFSMSISQYPNPWTTRTPVTPMSSGSSPFTTCTRQILMVLSPKKRMKAVLE